MRTALLLVKIHTGAADAKDVIAAAAAAVVGAPVGVPTATGVTKESPTCTPCDGGEGSIATVLHQGTLRGELVPTLATSNPALQDTNVLHEIDAAVQVQAWRAVLFWCSRCLHTPEWHTLLRSACGLAVICTSHLSHV